MTHLQNGSCQLTFWGGGFCLALHCRLYLFLLRKFTDASCTRYELKSLHFKFARSGKWKTPRTHTHKWCRCSGDAKHVRDGAARNHILFWARMGPPRSSPSWLRDKACRSTLQNSTSPELHINYKMYLFQEECIPLNWDRVPGISHVPSRQSCGWGHFLCSLLTWSGWLCSSHHQ